MVLFVLLNERKRCKNTLSCHFELYHKYYTDHSSVTSLSGYFWQSIKQRGAGGVVNVRMCPT